MQYLLYLFPLSSPQGNDGATALHTAAYTGNVSLVELLLLNGANPDVRDSWGRLPPALGNPPSQPKVSQDHIESKQLSNHVCTYVLVTISMLLAVYYY